MDDRMFLFFGACCKLGCLLHTTTAPSCCIPALYCHLLATLQTISITVVNLQDNRAAFRIFIALLRFSFDSPSYIQTYIWTLHKAMQSTVRYPNDIQRRYTDFQKNSSSHLKILGNRRVICSKCHPQCPQILGTTIQNSVGWVTWSPGTVHPWYTTQILEILFPTDLDRPHHLHIPIAR